MPVKQLLALDLVKMYVYKDEQLKYYISLSYQNATLRSCTAYCFKLELWYKYVYF